MRGGQRRGRVTWHSQGYEAGRLRVVAGLAFEVLGERRGRRVPRAGAAPASPQRLREARARLELVGLYRGGAELVEELAAAEAAGAREGAGLHPDGSS